MPVAPPIPSIAPVCPYFYMCGGCDTQDVPYREQLAHKDAWLKDLFKPLAQAEGAWLPLVGSPDEYPIYFRNKIRFGFVRKDGRVFPSRHSKGSEKADIAAEQCFLQSPETDRLMNFVADFATRHDWTIYDPITSQGWLKHLLVRQGKETGEMMAVLVTDLNPIPKKKAFIAEITALFPGLTSLYHTVTWGKSNEQSQDELLHGAPTILEKVGSLTFSISPHAFFQTNGAMVTTLYDLIAEAAGPAGQGSLWDLYAGSATIGTYLNPRFKAVTSIESNPQNIADARENLMINKVENLEILEGTVESIMTSAFINARPHPDVIVVDPPRAGLSPRLKGILPYVPAHRLVYVSCNPMTCLRDLQELLRGGYRLTSLQGVDMFPHTLHCEMIACLER